MPPDSAERGACSGGVGRKAPEDRDRAVQVQAAPLSTRLSAHVPAGVAADGSSARLPAVRVLAQLEELLRGGQQPLRLFFFSLLVLSVSE